MFKLVIRVPGEVDQFVTVDGDEAVIGKAPTCSVPLRSSALVGKYVSREHVKVQVGVFVTDLKSVNGVWSGGRRIEGAALLQGRKFHLGANPENSPEIEILEEPGPADASSGRDRAEVDRLQGRVRELEAEVERLKSAASDATVPAEPDVRPRAGTTPAMPATRPPPGSGNDAGLDDMTGGPRDLADSIPSFGDVFFSSGAGAGPGKADKRPPEAPARATNVRDESARGHAPPRPAPPPHAPHSGTRRELQHVTELIDRLVREDVPDDPLYEAPVEEFFALESFRLLRQVEKVVTRLSRDFVQLYDMKTELPNQQDNFRSLAAVVLMDPDDRVARRDLVKYLEELRRWLGVSLSANRKAALQLARELKKDLSIDSLTADHPVPLLLKSLGQEGNELWRRARVHLHGLTDEAVEDRIDRYASAYAKEVMDREREGPLYG